MPNNWALLVIAFIAASEFWVCDSSMKCLPTAHWAVPENRFTL